MTLFVGTSTGVYRFDGGLEKILGGAAISHLARDGETLWTLDGAGRVHRDDEIVAAFPDGTTPLCLQPTQETVWIGANEARLFGFAAGSVFEDEFFADAPGRDTWYTPWGDPADIRSMTLDADHTLYINVHVGGILRYDNTGVVPTLDIDADVHQVVAHPRDKGSIFAACAHGLAASRNGHDFEIRSGGLHAAYCRAVAVLDEVVYVSASTGPRTGRGRLYRGALFEGEFEPLTEGLPDWFGDNLDTHCLIADSKGIYVGLDSTIWHSLDRGDSWDVLVTDLPGVTCLA